MVELSYEQPRRKITDQEKEAIIRLRSTGLICRRCLYGPFRNGFYIWKPASIGGNFREGFEPCGFIRLLDVELEEPPEPFDDVDGDDPESNAPAAWLFPTPEGKWHFILQVFCGARGPGDFENEHPTVESAVDDIIDYYFGDPVRMSPPELIEREARLAANREAVRENIQRD